MHEKRISLRVADNASPLKLEQTSFFATVERIIGLKVIAEEVKTGDQLDFLKAEGCEEFQGFLPAKPLAAGELEQLLERSRRRMAYAIARPLTKAFRVQSDEYPCLTETPAVSRK